MWFKTHSKLLPESEGTQRPASEQASEQESEWVQTLKDR